jgi:alkylation response protein AidB-like acyl-CoA dehydrogenase
MQKEVLPVVERLYKHDWDLTRQLLRKASELDLLRLEIPAEYGGLGLDLISASFVGEQIALNPSFGGSLGAHTSIGTLPLVYFGTDQQKAKYLPRLASGELIGAYCLTEPQSGSDALAARTTATLTSDGRHYLLNGQKMWITNGGFADLFTIFAKVIDGDRGIGAPGGSRASSPPSWSSAAWAWSAAATDQARTRWLVDHRADARQSRCRSKTCLANRPGAQRRSTSLNFGRVSLAPVTCRA